MSAPAALTFDEAGRRHDVNQLGLWIFLATVGMLFAAFTSAYLVRQGGDDWSRVGLPGMLWGSTGVLALSSVAVERARRSGARGRWTAASASITAAVVLGAGFLGTQVLAWRALMAAGVYLPATPHSSFFYMMTGAHAVHVMAALIVLGWGAMRTWDGTGMKDARRWRETLDTCATFWHFLLAVWLYLFVVLSLV